MQVKYNKRFFAQLAKIKSKEIIEEIIITIKLVENSNKIQDLPHCKKMIGYINFYRIRVDNYRLGVEIIGNLVIIKQVAHRSIIYTHFPKYRKPTKTFKKRK